MAAEQHQAMTEFNEALRTAFDGGAFDDLAGFYTEDAVILPPRGRILEGRGSVAAFWRGVKTRFAGMTFTTTGLKDLGEATKRESGTYASVPVDGAAPAVDGKYVFVWQLVDGEWQIESSIWNRSGGPGQGQGQQGQAGGQRRGGGPGGGSGGGQRRQGPGGQGGGYRQGGYRQGGQGGGGYRQGGQGGGGYRQGGLGGGRPPLQGGGGIGGGGIGGGGRRGAGGGPRRGGAPGGGQGGPQGGGSLYEQSGGLYSDLKE